MSANYVNEPMLDLFIFESTQLIEQMELLIISNEKSSSYSSDAINEIFRIMHTIKGSSAMMLYNNISTLAHSMEDLFFVLPRIFGERLFVLFKRSSLLLKS